MTTAIIQGVDPRTGAPVGEAVPETDQATLESVLGRCRRGGDRIRPVDAGGAGGAAPGAR